MFVHATHASYNHNQRHSDIFATTMTTEVAHALCEDVVPAGLPAIVAACNTAVELAAEDVPAAIRARFLKVVTAMRDATTLLLDNSNLAVDAMSRCIQALHQLCRSNCAVSNVTTDFVRLMLRQPGAQRVWSSCSLRTLLIHCDSVFVRSLLSEVVTRRMLDVRQLNDYSEMLCPITFWDHLLEQVHDRWSPDEPAPLQEASIMAVIDILRGGHTLARPAPRHIKRIVMSYPQVLRHLVTLGLKVDQFVHIVNPWDDLDEAQSAAKHYQRTTPVQWVVDAAYRVASDPMEQHVFLQLLNTCAYLLSIGSDAHAYAYDRAGGHVKVPILIYALLGNARASKIHCALHSAGAEVVAAAHEAEGAMEESYVPEAAIVSELWQNVCKEHEYYGATASDWAKHYGLEGYLPTPQ